MVSPPENTDEKMPDAIPGQSQNEPETDPENHAQGGTKSYADNYTEPPDPSTEQGNASEDGYFDQNRKHDSDPSQADGSHSTYLTGDGSIGQAGIVHQHFHYGTNEQADPSVPFLARSGTGILLDKIQYDTAAFAKILRRHRLFYIHCLSVGIADALRNAICQDICFSNYGKRIITRRPPETYDELIQTIELVSEKTKGKDILLIIPRWQGSDAYFQSLKERFAFSSPAEILGNYRVSVLHVHYEDRIPDIFGDGSGHLHLHCSYIDALLYHHLAGSKEKVSAIAEIIRDEIARRVWPAGKQSVFLERLIEVGLLQDTLQKDDPARSIPAFFNAHPHQELLKKQQEKEKELIAQPLYRSLLLLVSLFPGISFRHCRILMMRILNAVYPGKSSEKNEYEMQWTMATDDILNACGIALYPSNNDQESLHYIERERSVTVHKSIATDYPAFIRQVIEVLLYPETLADPYLSDDDLEQLAGLAADELLQTQGAYRRQLLLAELAKDCFPEAPARMIVFFARVFSRLLGINEMEAKKIIGYLLPFPEEGEWRKLSCDDSSAANMAQGSAQPQWMKQYEGFRLDILDRLMHYSEYDGYGILLRIIQSSGHENTVKKARQILLDLLRHPAGRYRTTLSIIGHWLSAGELQQRKNLNKAVAFALPLFPDSLPAHASVPPTELGQWPPAYKLFLDLPNKEEALRSFFHQWARWLFHPQMNKAYWTDSDFAGFTRKLSLQGNYRWLYREYREKPRALALISLVEHSGSPLTREQLYEEISDLGDSKEDEEEGKKRIENAIRAKQEELLPMVREHAMMMNFADILLMWFVVLLGVQPAKAGAPARRTWDMLLEELVKACNAHQLNLLCWHWENHRRFHIYVHNQITPHHARELAATFRERWEKKQRLSKNTAY